MAYSPKLIVSCLRKQLSRKNYQYLQKKAYSTADVHAKDDEILVDKVFDVTTIGINRPNKRNCVNPEVARKLRAAVTNFEDDPSSSVAVLYGTGGNFCSGFDLETLAEVKSFESLRKEIAAGGMGLTRRITKKPLIAAVSGYAVAGGFELALLCDLRVVEETAVMGVFCRRFGVPLVDGGTVRLQAMVGLSRALDLILTGRPIKAKEAFEWGLANRVVACGTALGQAVQLASSLVKFPQACMLADRDSVYNSAFNAKTFEEGMEYEKNSASDEVIAEAVKGARRFLSGTGKHGTTQNLTEDFSPQ
ncbi:probable enoyl-CoA hydratase echA8 [Schistocerca cancellata]|uniref:probable enoyl-CoA hydratase echA8 n=1 Tax=Schistocerca cancellata TaxID=274614 RepID=UPI002118BAA2|nr:probable enoyl-CoA hydratase echA8 [Schistocerca cancellata]